ncbi:urease accessory protein UreD [Pelotomaculum terephthalicicum JT]|uniref:urease accessory protein UreD n=1 Tax=Pelotomaculum TaxID=191373 RepID=UPI001F033FFB|nr:MULTISPECIES: urease accessory protein UreD [Pelotomaculum]MCG9969838.1 urease accessory protein UreD [Pelotomaculum terephthalicicum JT]
MRSETGVKQSTISTLILGIFFLIAVLLGGSILYMNSSLDAEHTAEKRRTEFKQLGNDLADASDYLTEEARKYAVTKDIAHLNKYREEINVTKTRDNIPYAGSSFQSVSECFLKSGSAFVYSDIFACGRAKGGERFKFKEYRNCSKVYYQGDLIYLDHQVLVPGCQDLEGIGNTWSAKKIRPRRTS